MDNDLIALVVHDLRNPLAALLSNLGFIAQSVRDADATAEAVQDCQLSAEELSRLVDNVGTMGVLEAGVTPPGESIVSEVIASAESRMRPHAETSTCRLETSCEPDVGGVALSSKLLALAIDNLVATSMAYAPTGSTIRVEARMQDARTAVVAVIDAGPPVTVEARGRVTLKEAQLEAKTASGARYGRGLGLYVVDLIARVAGGELEIGESNGGSSIELRLPAIV